MTCDYLTRRMDIIATQMHILNPNGTEKRVVLAVEEFRNQGFAGALCMKLVHCHSAGTTDETRQIVNKVMAAYLEIVDANQPVAIAPPLVETVAPSNSCPTRTE